MVTFVVTWHSCQGDRDEKVPGHYLTHIHSCYIWQNSKTSSSLHRTELFSRNQTQSWLTPNTNGQLRLWERWNLYNQENLWDDVVVVHQSSESGHHDKVYSEISLRIVLLRGSKPNFEASKPQAKHFRTELCFHTTILDVTLRYGH